MLTQSFVSFPTLPYPPPALPPMAEPVGVPVVEVADTIAEEHGVAAADAAEAPVAPAKPLTEEEFGMAFATSFPLTLRFLLSRGVAADVAEEVAQAAWVKAWECREQLQRPHMIAAWVNSIAKNMLKNRMRTEKRLESLNDTARTSTTPQASVDMSRILQRCEGRDAKILWGYYVEGYTTEEIARLLGLSPVAVRVRMLRLRNSLRNQLLTKPQVNRIVIAEAA